MVIKYVLLGPLFIKSIATDNSSTTTIKIKWFYVLINLIYIGSIIWEITDGIVYFQEYNFLIYSSIRIFRVISYTFTVFHVCYLYSETPISQNNIFETVWLPNNNIKLTLGTYMTIIWIFATILLNFTIVMLSIAWLIFEDKSVSVVISYEMTLFSIVIYCTYLTVGVNTVI